MNETPVNAMATYNLFGSTGLRVSPLCLGTMTFGWGADKNVAKSIFQRYLGAGGNFFDTADVYSEGVSEEWLGGFIAEQKNRDKVVVATKFTFNADKGNVNAGGNGRKNIRRALEGSLRRLQTDYVDVYWMHAWDRLTPVEEVLSTLNDLVREGKVLHIGMSNVPAWYGARAQTLAIDSGFEPLAALQMEYSLISRNVEREHIDMMTELGIGLCPWSPLASGFLTGKYRREQGQLIGEGRVQEVKSSGNPVLEKFARDQRNWEILDVLLRVATEIERSPAQVALNWIVQRPTVCSTLIGATKIDHLEGHLSALDFEIPADLFAKLEAVSRPAENELDHFFGAILQEMIHGGAVVGKS